jgi:hypothetical protein
MSLGIQEGAHIPADDFAAIEVQNGRQEKPAFPGFNVSDIRHPDLVDFRGFGRLRQKIGSNGMVMVAVGGAEPVTALLPTVKVVRSHESSDTVAAMLEAALAQLIDDARAAIGFAALEVDGFNLLSQSLVFLSSFTGFELPFLPVVIAAERDLQDLAEHRHRMMGFHRVDPLVALTGGSERMPKVFFKISRCSFK